MTDEHGNEENRRWQADAQTGDATPLHGPARKGTDPPGLTSHRGDGPPRQRIRTLRAGPQSMRIQMMDIRATRIEGARGQ